MIHHYDTTVSLSAIFFSRYPHHRDLHSFPTRRSSDLCSAQPALYVDELGFVSPSSSGNAAITAPPNIAQNTDRKSTRLNSSHANNSYAVFCLKKKKDDL